MPKDEMQHRAILLPVPEVRTSGDTGCIDVSGQGFACAKITDHDDGDVVILVDDQIVAARNFLNAMIQQYNLE